MALNLRLDKMPWYGQLGTFATLSLISAGVFWNWYAKPETARIESRRATLAGLRTEIERGRQTTQSLPQFRSQVANLEVQLDRLRAVLPEEKDVGDLLRRIQAMATQSNLTIRGFTPQAVAMRQMYAEWPIGLQLEGTYHNLGDFLERISKFPRIINVTAIKIRGRENPTQTNTIMAECTATTFVMTEPPASAAPAAPGTPAKPGAQGAPSTAPTRGAE